MKYISILRGINVSGQKLIKMVDLKAHCLALGYKNVQTYIQSGNLLFDSEEKDTLKISVAIKSKIKEVYGFEVPVLTLSINEFIDAEKQNPFRENAIEQLYITFLESEPEAKNIEAIDAEKYLPDEFTVKGKCIYLNIVNGYGKTKLNNNMFEKKLNVVATTRNVKTVNKLIALSEG